MKDKAVNAWGTEDQNIRTMLDWPLNKLVMDVEIGFWWPEWGDRPADADERREIIRAFLTTRPSLIPLLGHRFVPESPCKAGNPVFSMFGFDTIYYGSNLSEYFANEFSGRFAERHVAGPTRHIPFWSEIIDHHDVAYAYYAASDNYRGTIAACEKRNRNLASRL